MQRFISRLEKFIRNQRFSTTSPLRAKPIAIALAIALAASFGWESIAIAQYVPPPDVGIPGRRRAAGTRLPGSCVRGEVPLTALLPEDAYGLTMFETTTWFWYKPETNATTAEFSLLDEAGNSIYEAILTLPAEAQVVSFTLPEAMTLEADAEYQWYFSIVCDPDDRSQDIFTRGWIRSIEPSPALLEELDLNMGGASAESAAANGLWYDAIATIASQRRQSSQFDPSASETAWRSLLESVDLGDLADVPLSETDLSIAPDQP